jgi:hypothetical protein
MGKELLELEGSAAIASNSMIARLNLDIEQYEGLLRSSLGPKARKMFEHLLARARSELAVIEAEGGMSQPWLAEASIQR